jgi:hypothetical protein
MTNEALNLMQSMKQWRYYTNIYYKYTHEFLNINKYYYYYFPNNIT